MTDPALRWWVLSQPFPQPQLLPWQRQPRRHAGGAAARRLPVLIPLLAPAHAALPAAHRPLQTVRSGQGQARPAGCPCSGVPCAAPRGALPARACLAAR